MAETLRIRVTDQGVLVPKKLLSGIEEVEIHREADRVVLSPAQSRDPIFGLGSDPVACEAPDASENLDHYLYASK
jgi:virulence-associated protein VagC